ncbi:MAG: tRNA pseudouridine(38-40) synthase TruA [Clostridium sp.]|jgi:tRNA pseudouridine38-40 synthase|nr:tRNA pseudouridine(38-40) synthase TruA [Clostridium sp.]
MVSVKRRVRLRVAYDGTAYHGWQLQPGAVTIESELNGGLSRLLGEEIRVIGASRTDTGVHALDNIAVFDTASRIPAPKIAYALNQRLPQDIRIRKSEEVSADWHPRRCASRKTYEYRVYRGEFPMPVRRLYSLFTYRDLDVSLMRRGAGYLEGEHDFGSFCRKAACAESTVRILYRVEILEEEEELAIRVCGNGFLYHMVRILVGTLLEVGEGKRRPEDLPALLLAKDREKAGPTAPAHGLTLMKYEFGETMGIVGSSNR